MLKHREYASFIEAAVNLTKIQNVEFSIFCVKSCQDSFNQRNTSVARCVKLVDKWLHDNTSVTMRELECAAGDARNQFHNTENRLYLSYKSVIFAAGEAAYCAASFTNNSDFAASCAEAVSNVGVTPFLYKVVMNSYFTTTKIKQPFTELECKLVYLLDDTDEDIIVKHGDYYFINMPGIEHLHALGFKTQDALLKTILESTDLFWCHVRKWLNRLYP